MSNKKTRSVAVNTTIASSSAVFAAAIFFLLSGVFKTSDDIAKVVGAFVGFGVAVIGLSVKSYIQEVEDLPSTEYADLMKEVSGAIGHTRRTGTPEQCKAVMDSGTQLIRTAANGMAIANQADAILLQKQGQQHEQLSAGSGNLLSPEDDQQSVGSLPAEDNILYFRTGRGTASLAEGNPAGDRQRDGSWDERDGEEPGQDGSRVGDCYGAYSASSNACQPDPEPVPRKRASRRRAEPAPSPSPLYTPLI
jgi:hypothetical protein